MKSQTPHTARGQLYGVNAVTEALRAERRAIDGITIAEGARDQSLRQLIDLAREHKVPVKRAPRATLDRLARGAKHQGVVAQVAAARYADADDLLDFISTQTGNGDAPLVVVVDGVEDPRNLGAILRTAECAGASGVFIPERRAAGLNDTVAKTSAGAVEYLSVARVTNLSRLIEQLKERNVWVVGAAADAAMNYTQWDWSRPTALVLGGEGAGLHRLVRERCDALVKIPVHGKIESLNVSVAAGVVLFEAARQRSMAKQNER
ncbi:MAG: 23S rRNA (guanosine(2251)-2'-O)-methyltransferase RlmB [Acidobacteria bacterium]|nr:MAG: 23S rRNA (guanosine(2251)-2'-O)-methyltransferase RlmB [Acidobacteriota bacterium]